MAEATEIRAILGSVRRVRRAEQKALRHALRASGFYISDWARPATGFTRRDFDHLIDSGRIRVD
ncbi:MAG: hypothetical protein ACSLFR_13520 [Solirubrobacteraceae bacterium]